MKERLNELQEQLKSKGLNGVVIPMNDEFQGEYIPDCAKRLEWMTGFNGSNGVAIVLQDKAAFFTDGRYTIQAKEQVSDAYEHYNMMEKSPYDWAAEQLQSSDILGFDPWLHSKDNVARYEAKHISMQPVAPNLIDQLWKDQPAPPSEKVKIHELVYAGVSSEEKRQRLASYLAEKNIDSIILTAPDSICWLLNIRGDDVPHTPFCLCYAEVKQDGSVALFVDREKVTSEVSTHLGKDVCVYDNKIIAKFFAEEPAGKTIQIDPSHASCWFFQALDGHTIIEEADPCQLWKACKNNTEIQGTKAAHIRDGVAVTRFLHWLDNNLDTQLITELSAAERLESFRREDELCQDLSFDTISGFAEHGAVVHYRVTQESSKQLRRDNLYLVDSGGQYLDGTTDITRTISLGTPTKEQKEHYTRVLKGHIALSEVVFPEGTTGSQLDVLARYHLWQVGLDYDHGTGHGVGSYLSVHEGPQRISKMPNSITLQSGMILSNEPGYYQEGDYGIRIENLVLVIEKPELSTDKKRFFGFETITKAPLDISLIDQDLLTDFEWEWVQKYHDEVKSILKPLLDKEVYQWLESVVN